MIKRYIPFNLAVAGVVIMNTAVIIFHVLILGRIIPYDIVWGGRLNSANDMYVFEVISIGVNILLILVTVAKAGWLNLSLSIKLVNGILWGFVVLFVLNTIGNLKAITSIEMIIATPLTTLLAIICWRIAIE